MIESSDWENNFDPEFVQMKPRESIAITNKTVIEPYEDVFKEFNYVNPAFEKEIQKIITKLAIENEDTNDSDSLSNIENTNLVISSQNYSKDEKTCVNANNQISSHMLIKE